MTKKNIFSLSITLLILTISTRFLPLPANLSPIGAAALFGGVFLSNKWFKYLVPLTILWISDIVLNNLMYPEFMNGFTLFYSGSGWNYLSFMGIILIGSFIRENKQINVILGAFGASLLFFIVSNFGVWISTPIYSKSIQGLIQCYTLAIPFFKNTLIGNLVFSGILFGAYELISKKLTLLPISN